jgi:hypothetical protein
VFQQHLPLRIARRVLRAHLRVPSLVLHGVVRTEQGHAADCTRVSARLLVPLVAVLVPAYLAYRHADSTGIMQADF